MELDDTAMPEGVKASQIDKLEKSGMADLKLLRSCWKDYVSAPGSASKIELRHLCLLLQANCLIFPVQSTAASNGNASAANPTQKYIIPGKLPPPKPDINWITCCGATFYFDFNTFLPDEIYHKLICLASSEAQPTGKLQNRYSSQICIFCGLFDTNWAIEIEREKQRLKISVA